MTTVRSSQLATLLREGRPSSDPELKRVLTGLVSEVKSRLASGSRDNHDFFVSVSDSVQEIRGSAHWHPRAECLFGCVQFFYISGSPLLAILPAREWVRLAESSGDKLELRRALNALGIVCADTGNFGEALEHYACALHVARSTRDGEGEAGTWTNLSTALTYMSRQQEALTCLEQARLCAPTGAQGNKVRRAAAHNMSICFFILGDPEKARLWSEQAMTDEDPTDSGEMLSSIIREQHYVEALLELGHFELARSRWKRAFHLAVLANTTRAAQVAKVIECLVDAYCGQVDKAIEALKDLLVSLSVRGVAPESKDAFRALARAYEMAGQPEKALDCLQQILDSNRKHREEGVLAHIAIAGGAMSADFRARFDLSNLHQKHASLKAKVAQQELFRSQLEVLERLAVTADLREEESGAHGYRVGRLSAMFAEELGWLRDDCTALEQAARLHDIGKIGIPDRVLLSTASLQESERNLMLAHTSIGAELLAKSSISQLCIAEEIARSHHEWWDGTGYPAGSKGTRIPVHARVVALADVFDSLTHGRTYEKPWTLDRALVHIANLSGKQFDPALTSNFVAFVRDLAARHDDLDEFLGSKAAGSPVLQARSRIRALVAGKSEGLTRFDLATSKS
jgi:putative two-component system response regulator